MRSLFYPLLFLTAILLIGVVVLLLSPDSWQHASASISDLLSPSSTKKADPPPPAPDGKSKRTPGRKASSGAAQGPDLSQGLPGALPPRSETNPPDLRFPFPVAEQVPAGTPRSTILATFGRPEATVTGAESGQLRERYVYVDRATGRRTFIFLVNASVTKVETLSQ